MADERSTSGPESGDDDAAGRPVRGRDELDTERFRLPRPRTRIGPLLAGSVIVFCIYMMVQMRHDLAFARQGDEPDRFQSTEDLLGKYGASPESYVEVEAVPDRAFVAMVGADSSDGGHRAAPVLGTGGRLWLLLDANVWAAEIDYDEIYRGRLRSLDDMPFGDGLRAFVRDEVGPRFVTGEALREALAGGSSTVATPTGDSVEVEADSPVTLQIERGDRSVVRAAPTEAYPDDEAWREALAEAGVPVTGPALTGPKPGSDPEEPYVFSVSAPAAEVERALADARLLTAWAEPVIEERRTTWSLLGAGARGFNVDGLVIDHDDVRWAAIDTTRELPDNAFVIVVGEQPDGYWYILPLYGIMALFVLLMAWALARSLREESTTEAADAAGAK